MLAAVVYGRGSVLARPLILDRGRLGCGVTMLLGGVMLLATSFTFEPLSRTMLEEAWGGAAWARWLFLVLFGFLAGMTIYLRVLDDWGASKAGCYSFVSPVIAVLTGMVVYGETVT